TTRGICPWCTWTYRYLIGCFIWPWRMCGATLQSRAFAGVRNRRAGVASTTHGVSTKSIVPAPVPIERVLGPPMTRKTRKQRRGPSPAKISSSSQLNPTGGSAMSDNRSTPSASPILRSTRKRDDLPKGLNRHPAGGYFIRYACAVGHIHEQRTGRSLEVATKKLGKCRADAENGWCPRREREQRRETEAAKRQAQAQDVTVRQLGVRWLKTHVEPNLRVRTAAQYRSV